MYPGYGALPQLPTTRPNGLSHFGSTPALPSTRPPPIPTGTHPGSDPNIYRYSYHNPEQVSHGEIFILSSASESGRSSSTLHNHGHSPSATSLIQDRHSLQNLVSTGQRSSIAHHPYSRHPDNKPLDRAFSTMTLDFPKPNIPRSQSQDNLASLNRHVLPAGRVSAEAGSEWGSETSFSETDQLTSASRFKSFKVTDTGSSAASRKAEIQYRTSVGALPIYPPARSLNNTTTSPRILQSNSYSMVCRYQYLGVHSIFARCTESNFQHWPFKCCPQTPFVF